MNSTEIIEEGEERNRICVVLKILREAIRQPREATILRSGRQIAALDVGR
jgi:hypothetical protein